MGISTLIEDARHRYRRLSPHEAAAAVASGDGLIVDTRCADQRRDEGVIPASIHAPLSVLPWRADPQSGHDDARISSGGRDLILICQDGYSSTLAVATLLDLGHDRVTDIAGGFGAWRAAGLPVIRDGDAAAPSAAKRRQHPNIGDHLQPKTERPKRF